MYKCGWNGCEKAYGTLNHLNAHVTMQSHGSKRTPEGKFIYRSVARAKTRTHASQGKLSCSCDFGVRDGASVGLRPSFG